MFKVISKNFSMGASKEIDFNFFNFSDGSVHFNLLNENWIYSRSSDIEIETDFKNPLYYQYLILLKDFFKDRIGKNKKFNWKLKLLYTPYSRQDRKTSDSEPFSLRAFCSFLNFLEFDEVEITDPHSDVLPALINNVRVVKRYKVFDLFFKKYFFINLPKKEKYFLLSPDAGAFKKNEEVLKEHRMYEKKLGDVFEHISAIKVRDVSTQSILKYHLNTDANLNDSYVLMSDDICDGGRTFVEAAKIIKEKYNNTYLHLFTTFGIYCNGKEELNKYFSQVDCFYNLHNK